jgi:hypothetical protein
MTKTYQSIVFKELHRQVIVEGNKVAVDFTGGVNYPKTKNGIFTTNDVNIQKAMEADKSFNKAFRLIYKQGEVVYEDKPALTDKEHIKTLYAQIEELKAKLAKYEKKSVVPVIKPIEGIINAQQARAYLIKEVGIDKKRLPSPVSIRNAGLKNNVSFPDWGE